MPFVWNGVLDPSLLADDVVSAGHRLADAAKVGDWKTVFELLDDPTERVDVNWWRPGGTAWFTVLHQAAWHGAPTRGGRQTHPAGSSAIGDRLPRAHTQRRSAGQAARDEPHERRCGAGVEIARTPRKRSAGAALTAVAGRCFVAQ